MIGKQEEGREEKGRKERIAGSAGASCATNVIVDEQLDGVSVKSEPC